ncbi:GAF domain-containing protein [Modestobacter versicolor]|uniref:GAF domain-containing protein n=1 Tax=Modestobacter versicolor TaxID=429133 RepID=UPI0034DEA04A
MTLAERFAAALADTRADPGTDADDQDGHLLPDRLARAVTRVLDVDGAGLSVLAGPHGRAPLGASSPDAARVERLQFTAGVGPCRLAHASGQPVFVVEADLRHRWPAFADLLFTSTPFRGIVALPLRPPISGALDLFLRDPGDVARLDVFDAVTVGDLVTSALADAAVFSTWSEATGPDWLHSPAAERRALVWQAVGRAGAALDLDAPAALALLRAHAYTAGRSVDSVAADLVRGRLVPADVAGRPAAG